MGLSFPRKCMAIGGFIILGLSPSFMDWQQSPGKRWQIVIFYIIAIALFWFGLLK